MGRRWIVNCDDVGMHPAVNAGVGAVLEAGVVRSASIMAPAAFFDEGVDVLRATGTRAVGVHLTLCAEYPGLPMRALSGADTSFADADGWLGTTPPTAERGLDPREVETEWRLQVERVLDAGLAISHLDGHMFCHEPAVTGTPALLEVARRLATGLGVPVRCREAFPGRSVATTRFIWRDHPTRESRLAWYSAWVAEAGDGDSVSELIIHPALEHPDLDQMRNPVRRLADAEFFTDPGLAGRLAAAGIEVVGWQDVPAAV